ncbi:MAG: CBS domain-containing protein [Desulfobacterales bacterium]|nr:CBS domain-containing protein [Pseudomonadota bacterium]MCG2772547.1 CBS domain-containing protein [Desulfobacterales bacterium]
MSLTARDVMDDCFQTLRPEMSIAEAVRIFQRAGRVSGQKVFGIMVTDASRALVGMLSIYDIFLLLGPKHIRSWGEMEDLDVSGLLEAACRRAQAILVGDIMTTEVISITPETHLLLIIDIMIKKHVRRLPVLEGGKIAGIVYISRVFEHILAMLTG